MAKFYIESAEIKKIIDASDPFDACVKTLKRHLNKAHESGRESVVLGEYFIVSERGFRSSRPNSEVNTVEETTINTKKIFREINK